MTYLTVHLQSTHIKENFSCGKGSLDDYLKKQASQDIKRKLAACFVLLGNGDAIINGYYTLSNDSVPAAQLPEAIRIKMPRSYAALPTTLLGRLAVDRKVRGQGLGELLLFDALRRAYDISEEMGSMAVVVDPLDDDAVTFYKKFRFIDLPDSGRMFLPMKTVAHLF
jgi:GNAT superfamily N-acetyltransferase